MNYGFSSAPETPIGRLLVDENWTPAVARRLNAGGHVVERREKHFQSVLRLSRVHSVNFLGSLSLIDGEHNL